MDTQCQLVPRYLPKLVGTLTSERQKERLEVQHLFTKQQITERDLERNYFSLAMRYDVEQ